MWFVLYRETPRPDAQAVTRILCASQPLSRAERRATRMAKKSPNLILLGGGLDGGLQLTVEAQRIIDRVGKVYTLHLPEGLRPLLKSMRVEIVDLRTASKSSGRSPRLTSTRATSYCAGPPKSAPWWSSEATPGGGIRRQDRLREPGAGTAGGAPGRVPARSHLTLGGVRRIRRVVRRSRPPYAPGHRGLSDRRADLRLDGHPLAPIEVRRVGGVCWPSCSSSSRALSTTRHPRPIAPRV